ncbi:MAG: hypothetical protein ABI140_16320 [Jatrophihabitantaceae bacterium]
MLNAKVASGVTAEAVVSACNLAAERGACPLTLVADGDGDGIDPSVVPFGDGTGDDFTGTGVDLGSGLSGLGLVIGLALPPLLNCTLASVAFGRSQPSRPTASFVSISTSRPDFSVRIGCDSNLAVNVPSGLAKIE